MDKPSKTTEEKEIEKLKKKCNGLIDVAEKLTEENSGLKEENLSLKEKIKLSVREKGHARSEEKENPDPRIEVIDAGMEESMLDKVPDGVKIGGRYFLIACGALLMALAATTLLNTTLRNAIWEIISQSF